MDDTAPSINRMYTDIEWALSQGLPPAELVPMVERLVKEAAPGTLHSTYAKRQLAELIVRKEPFRAARLARDVLAEQPDDDRAHAALGHACLRMGHFRVAERAYRAALALVPHCPWYAHNLGHLLDVALGRTKEALPLLRMSRRALPDEAEIAGSYAHALFALGRAQEGWEHLLAANEDNHARAHEIREGWQARLAAPPKPQ